MVDSSGCGDFEVPPPYVSLRLAFKMFLENGGKNFSIDQMADYLKQVRKGVELVCLRFSFVRFFFFDEEIAKPT